MCIGPLSTTFPYCGSYSANQTPISFFLRIHSVAFGIIFLGAGTLFLTCIPGYPSLGTIVGYTSISFGGILVLLASVFKCLDKETVTEYERKPVSFRDPVHIFLSKLAESRREDENKSYLDIVDPLQASQAIDVSSRAYSTPLADGSCPIYNLPTELLVHIFSYLGARALLNIQLVSKQFKELSDSHANLLWKKYLNAISWGPTKWFFSNETGKYYFSENSQGDEPNVFEQIKAQRQLLNEAMKQIKSNELVHPPLIYLALKMPGGPAAFQNIPQVNLGSPAELIPDDMIHPLIRGKIRQNAFFAMRLIDTERETNKPFILFFVQNGQSWLQLENPCWNRDQLRLLRVEDLNYILALIGNEDLSEKTEICALHLKKTIKLSI
jgi:hypothetical protein